MHFLSLFHIFSIEDNNKKVPHILDSHQGFPLYKAYRSAVRPDILILT